MKRDIPLEVRPDNFPDLFLKACGNLSWYDFVTGMPSLAFLVTGWKSNGKENACLHAWSAFSGSGPMNFMCVLSKVNTGGHMYRSLKETGVCVLNFPSHGIYEQCMATIRNNQLETDEITASGLTAEPALKVHAPRVKECFLNIECEYVWEHPLCEGGDEVVVALRAVNVCMDSERYDQHRLGRYGKEGYLFEIDQPSHPETGEITPFGPGILVEAEKA